MVKICKESLCYSKRDSLGKTTSQQSLISFIAICFNGLLCFALFNDAHISQHFYTVVRQLVSCMEKPVKLVAGTNWLASSIAIVQPLPKTHCFSIYSSLKSKNFHFLSTTNIFYLCLKCTVVWMTQNDMFLKELNLPFLLFWNLSNFYPQIYGILDFSRGKEIIPVK